MLRKLIVAALAALVLVPAAARAADAPATAMHFGGPIKLKAPVDVAQLAASPRKFKGRTVRLEGTVLDVCQGKGCWIEVADDKGASFMARSLDESMHFPRDCKGWHVVVQGRVTATLGAIRWEADSTGHTDYKPDWVVATRGVELTPGPVDSPVKSNPEH